MFSVSLLGKGKNGIYWNQQSKEGLGENTHEMMSDSTKKADSVTMPNPSKDLNTDTYWIESIEREFRNDGLGQGAVRKLKKDESKFWKELIIQCLKPLTQTKVYRDCYRKGRFTP